MNAVRKRMCEPDHEQMLVNIVQVSLTSETGLVTYRLSLQLYASSAQAYDDLRVSTMMRSAASKHALLCKQKPACS